MPESIQLINHSLNNNLVCQRKDNGYINATALCKACDRKIATYLRAETTKEFLSALSSEVQICTSELTLTIKGFGVQQGTWVHPYVAINLAQWASPKFAVAVSKWVFDWVNGQNFLQLRIIFSASGSCPCGIFHGRLALLPASARALLVGSKKTYQGSRKIRKQLA